MRFRELNVGCFGGGTGLPSLLGGLKRNPWLTVNAVVTMFDSGGSSGVLRDELGVLPPGDVLKCALALARNEREARRVLLARALVTAPRALVLDEPTTGLDLIARHAFMERVRQIAREGTTLILITHHIEEIVPEIERVILLRGGRILASGSKRSVLAAERLSGLFDAPVAIDEEGGYYYARPGGTL